MRFGSGMKALRFTAALAAAAALAACDTSSSGDGTVQGDPSVSFSEPRSGDVFTTTGAAVSIPVILSTANLSSTDRVQMLLGDAVVGYSSGAGAFTYTAVSVGTHVLRARVVDSVDTPYPGANAQAEIQIEVRTVQCARDGDCDDNDPCTTNSCEDGTCQSEPVPNCVAEACQTAADCVAAEGAAPTCRQWDCSGGTCSLADLAKGSACDDGDACTEGDACDAGACVGMAILCEDDNECTDNGCDPDSGCVFSANSAPCDDGNACTMNDTCDAGECSGTPVSCDDGIACTADTCEPASGCSNTPEDSLCDDGHACTTGTCDVASGCQYATDDSLCDDGNLCTDDACVIGQGCVATNNSAACDDGNLCTTGTACVGGACGGGVAVVCDDGNACTDDSCDPATGCVNTPNSAPCDDGDACTEDSVCSGGLCGGGGAISCDDANPCTDDSCDPVTGCVNAPNSAPCDDGDACTLNTQCSGGVCGGGEALACDDGNECTDDACDPATGCVHTPNSAPCDDGNPCTEGDVCSGGVCTSGTNICDCEQDADCAEQEDGNPCTGTLVCSNNVCTVDASTVVTCEDDGNPCTLTACNPSTGSCATSEVPSGTSCDDGDACTEDDACEAGTCVGAPLDCDDDNECTDDFCDAATGCENTPNSEPCDDGDACTEGDTCDAGVCVSGAAVGCDDGNPCTNNTCDPATGCVAEANSDPCDDGDACTEIGTCVAGECVVGPDVSCDDGNPCTFNVCNPATGCSNPPASGPCDDGDTCTVGDTCVGGQCLGSPLTCDDANPCTDDSCDSSAGCVFTPNSAPCDNGDPCTTGDMCSGGVCVAGTNTCDCQGDEDCAAFEDGNLCNGTLVCVANECVVDPATIVNCDGGVAGCMQDTCDPATGACAMVPVANGTACDDSDACTEGDTCTAGVCAGVAIACDDGDVCTSDACDPATGCTFTVLLGTACQDGDVCTTGDVCTATGCVGTPISCDDGNPCTANACDPATGCTSSPVTDGAPCDDGDPCTNFEECQAGACVAIGEPCDDGDPCTQNICVAGVGCANPAIDLANCDDGNPCTGTECIAGEGCNNPPVDGGACDDGDPCTTSDVCAGGACVGTPVDCDDGDPCTANACDPASGCTSTAAANGGACDDGDPCTEGDVCTGGVCAGAPIDCDDGDDCTDSFCDPALGCVQEPLSGLPCESDDPCDAVATCQAGQCVGIELAPECQIPGAACTVFGAAGDTVTCPLRLARAAQFLPTPAALSFKLVYPPSQLQPLQLQDQNCSSGTCITQPTPPNALWPSGHTVSPTPANVAVWAGSGSVVLSHPMDSGAALSTAYLDASGAVIGDAKIIEFQVFLINDIDPLQPVAIELVDAFATDAEGTPMAVETEFNLMVASGDLPDCVLFPAQCDDGIACTTDVCDPATKACINTPVNALCDDGIACTADSCQLDVGCVNAPNDSLCSDGNACTEDVCEVGTGCVFPAVANGTQCEDGSVCTSGDTCQEGTCTPGDPVDCNDGNPCTQTVCHPTQGCTNPPQNGVPCDNGDNCTVNDFCQGGACQAGQTVSTPGCEDEPAKGFCFLAGQAGDEVDCFFNLTACDELVPKATAMQFTLLWDSTRASIINFFGENCFGENLCFPLPKTGSGSQPLKTGHSMSISPNPVGGWNGTPCTSAAQCGGGACIANYCEGTEDKGGFGAAVLVNLSNPSAAFTTAYLDASGDIVGDPEFMWAKFKLLVDVDASEAVEVGLNQLLLTAASSLSLEFELVEDVIISCEPIIK